MLIISYLLLLYIYLFLSFFTSAESSCIAFAIIMGCSPIYISGLDLDYGLGYAEPDKDLLDEKPQHHMPNIGNVGHWKYVFKDFLRDDIRILNESAKLLGTEIINLNKKAWYSEFTKGDLTIL